VQVDACALLSIPAADRCRAEVCRQYGVPAEAQIGVGVDRLDYSKGIPHKLRAIERLLETRPELRQRLSFIQVAEPSRASLAAYRQVRSEVTALCARVNARFGTGSWQPVTLVERHLDAAAIYRLYRAADVCFVNSLADGMNLVAKEFVAAREDERGVLLLSEHAGAIHQLRSAVRVNPHDIGDTARQLATALALSTGEQRRRMRALRAVVAAADCYWWADQLLGAAATPVGHPRYGAIDVTNLRLTTF
jgi:trehalose 6-phosphate synthase